MKSNYNLLLQLIIYYLFGSLLELLCRKKHGMVFKVISGFLTYQVIFQICALPMIKMDQSPDKTYYPVAFNSGYLLYMG